MVTKIQQYKCTYLQKRNRLTHIENKVVVTNGEGGGISWEYGINRYMLLYIKQMNNKDLLYSIGNYTQYLIINYNGEEFLKRI